MVNGNATHNSFTSYDSAYTVFETRGSEVISIGLRDVQISSDCTTTGSCFTTSVPEPTTLAIFALGMIGLASRRFKKQS
jgi:hypothetical protein